MITTKELVNIITRGIQEKKGQDIVITDMAGIEGAICQYFIICQGNSPTQVDAIADSIEEFTLREASEKPVRVIGRDYSRWVAMDYTDVLVHILIPEMREYYNLEKLWEDAQLERLPNLD